MAHGNRREGFDARMMELALKERGDRADGFSPNVARAFRDAFDQVAGRRQGSSEVLKLIVRYRAFERIDDV